MKVFNPKDNVRVSIKFTKAIPLCAIDQSGVRPSSGVRVCSSTLECVRQSKGFIEADVGCVCGFDSVKSVGLCPSPCCTCSPNFLHRPRKQLQRILEAY